MNRNEFIPKIRITPKTASRTCYIIPTLGINCSCLHLEMGLIIFPDTQVSDRQTIMIYATREVAVHGLVYTKWDNALTGGFLALPIEALGHVYLLDCYTPRGDSAQIAISANRENTRITISNTQFCRLDDMIVEGEIHIDSHNSVVLKTCSLETSITGTIISSNNPIAVVVGSTNVYIPQNSSLDKGFIIEQLLPISAWGRDYRLAPLRNVTNGWIVRIIAYIFNTTVTIKNCEDSTGVTNHTITISPYHNPEPYHDIKSNRNTSRCRIAANQPIQVVQYMLSSNTSEYGDPSMMVIPPVKDFHGRTMVSATDSDIIDEVQPNPENKFKIHILPNNKRQNWNPCPIYNSTESPQMSNFPKYCYYHNNAGDKMYSMSPSNMSKQMLIRVYTQAKHVGAAMLGDIKVQHGKMN